MSWIKMRVNLAEDPAVIQMAEELSLPEDLIVGKLHRLWSWLDQHTTDGNAHGVTQKWVDRYVNADGFAAAMQHAAWLSVGADRISVPGFANHNGQSAKQRALTAIRAARCRNDAAVTPPLQEKIRVEKNIRTPTLEEAIEVGLNHKPAWAEPVVRAWFANRDSQGWEKGSGASITNWKSDLDAWAMKEARGDYTGGKNGTHQRNSAESRRNVGTANEGRSGQYAGVGKV